MKWEKREEDLEGKYKIEGTQDGIVFEHDNSVGG